MMVENMMFNFLSLMQKNVLVFYKHQNGLLLLVVHLLLIQISELLQAIQSLLMHLVHHIIAIYSMLHQEFNQGGKFVPEIASITFPIRFNEVLAVLPMMLDEPTPWHEMMIRPKAITTSTFKMVSCSNNTNYPKSRNNGCWIAVGI